MFLSLGVCQSWSKLKIFRSNLTTFMNRSGRHSDVTVCWHTNMFTSTSLRQFEVSKKQDFQLLSLINKTQSPHSSTCTDSSSSRRRRRRRRRQTLMLVLTDQGPKSCTVTCRGQKYVLLSLTSLQNQTQTNTTSNPTRHTLTHTYTHTHRRTHTPCRWLTLRSLCTTPIWWQWSTASRICWMQWLHANSRGSRLVWAHSATPPTVTSMQRQQHTHTHTHSNQHTRYRNDVSLTHTNTHSH